MERINNSVVQGVDMVRIEVSNRLNIMEQLNNLTIQEDCTVVTMVSFTIIKGKQTGNYLNILRNKCEKVFDNVE